MFTTLTTPLLGTDAAAVFREDVIPPNSSNRRLTMVFETQLVFLEYDSIFSVRWEDFIAKSLALNNLSIQ
jgi:hypothetical protein